MRRILLLFAFFAGVLTENDQKFTKCSHIFNPATFSCCSSMNFHKHKHIDSVKECLKIPISPNSCDRDICYANKMGFASSDGKIDKNEFKNHLENSIQDDTELKNAVIDSCVEGDLDKFGTEDICDLKKLKLCIDLQAFSLCKTWDTNGPCAGVQELAEECVELYA